MCTPIMMVFKKHFHRVFDVRERTKLSNHLNQQEIIKEMSMASKEEWCADKLSKLLNEDLRISTLTEIKEHFQVLTNTEAVQTAELLELPLVFDCLNDSNSEQVDLACEVLSLCMEKLDIVDTTNRYNVPLERALMHPNSGVKLMALEEVKRILKCDHNRKRQLIADISKRTLFINIIRCIGDMELKVATSACSIVTCFATVNIDCFIAPQILPVVKEVMGTNEVVRLRFYEVFIDICTTNENVHNKIIATGLLTSILHEINSNDILLRLNIVEMLYKLVEISHGYDYLEAEGFTTKLFKQLNDDADPVFILLYEPGVLKFFGHMAHCKANETFNKHFNVIDRIFKNLENSDYTLFKVSLETIGYISSVNKAILDAHVGPKLQISLTSLAERLQTLPTKEKVTTLAFLEELLKNPTDENSSQIARKWFNSFGRDPMGLVMHYVRNPFEEFRLSGLAILLSMANHNWGQEMIRNFPGLVEYLLDRNAETSKVAKDQKYAIIEKIIATDMGVFNHNILSKFQVFLNEGPHYVQAVTEVAVEGNE